MTGTHTGKIYSVKTDLVPSTLGTEAPWAISNLGTYKRKIKTNHGDVVHVIRVQLDLGVFILF